MGSLNHCVDHGHTATLGKILQLLHGVIGVIPGPSVNPHKEGALFSPAGITRFLRPLKLILQGLHKGEKIDVAPGG